jgi:plasmid stabilization system protein ParE
MSYTIAYLEKAIIEYEQSVIWYRTKSKPAAENFIAAIETRIADLKVNPEHYKKTYHRFHEVSLKKYPYSLVYFIDKKQMQVVIVAIYHHKRNPKKKFQ